MPEIDITKIKIYNEETFDIRDSELMEFNEELEIILDGTGGE